MDILVVEFWKWIQCVTQACYVFIYVDIKRGGYQRPHCDLNRGAKV